jgi:hypothetical protein
MRRALSVLLPMLVLGSSGRADAKCLSVPSTLLWSYPADGQQDVPLDATLRLFVRNSLPPAAQVTLDGVQLVLSESGGYPLGELEPSTDYEVHVTSADGQPLSGTIDFSLAFHTGTERSKNLAASPRVTDSIVDIDEPALTPPCAQTFDAHGCHDVPAWLRRIELQPDPDAVAWLLTLPPGPSGARNESETWQDLWPVECSTLLVDLQQSDADTCYKIAALSANGDVSEPTLYCPPAQALPPLTDREPERGAEPVTATPATTTSTPQAATQRSDAASCAVLIARGGPTRASAVVIAWLAAVVMLARRSSRRRGTHPRS